MKLKCDVCSSQVFSNYCRAMSEEEIKLLEEKEIYFPVTQIVFTLCDEHIKYIREIHPENIYNRIED